MSVIFLDKQDAKLHFVSPVLLWHELFPLHVLAMDTLLFSDVKVICLGNSPNPSTTLSQAGQLKETIFLLPLTNFGFTEADILLMHSFCSSDRVLWVTLPRLFYIVDRERYLHGDKEKFRLRNPWNSLFFLCAQRNFWGFIHFPWHWFS